MPEKSSDTGRVSNHPTELERASRACRSGFAVCAMFSLAINVLMLTLPIYMLQVYDRVLTTGRVETLIMLTLIATIALAVMCALDALRTSITIRVGCWLNEQLGPAYVACAVRGRLQGDLSGAQPLRDISQIQNFIATQGLTAFFDGRRMQTAHSSATPMLIKPGLLRALAPLDPVATARSSRAKSGPPGAGEAEATAAARRRYGIKLSE